MGCCCCTGAYGPPPSQRSGAYGPPPSQPTNNGGNANAPPPTYAVHAVGKTLKYNSTDLNSLPNLINLREFRVKYRETNTPCTFHNGLSVFKLPNINADVILNLCAEYNIQVNSLHGSTNSKPPFKHEEMSVKNFIENHYLATESSNSDPDYYFQQVPIGTLPKLAAYLGWKCPHCEEANGTGAASEKEKSKIEHQNTPDEVLFNSPLATPTLYMGRKGIVTSLHFDRGDYSKEGTNSKLDEWRSVDNVFMQVTGKKKFVLIPPKYQEECYAQSQQEVSGHVSSIATGWYPEPDFVAFPKFKQAWENRLEVDLEPGQVLFIPAWWWHCSYALEDGIGINCWFE